MNHTKIRTYITFLTLLNLGIFLAIAWAGWGRIWQVENTPELIQYLQLDAQQVLQWQKAEQQFLIQLKENELVIQTQRNALIEKVFADNLVLEEVQQARNDLALSQNQQQNIVVEQLLAEREILTAQQRVLLKNFLLQQATEPSPFEQLHTNE